MAAENRLWGAPRIHGELVKLGIAVSERTVSRYLRECPRGSSQTWRTFLANHYDQLTFISPESAAPDVVDVVNSDGLTYRHTPLLRDAPYRSHQRAAVTCDASPQRTSPVAHLVHDHLHHCSIRTSSGRSPPTTGPSPARSTASAESIDGPERHRSANNHAVSLVRTQRFEIAPPDDELTLRHSGARLRVWCGGSHTGRNIGEAHRRSWRSAALESSPLAHEW